MFKVVSVAVWSANCRAKTICSMRMVEVSIIAGIINIVTRAYDTLHVKVTKSISSSEYSYDEEWHLRVGLTYSGSDLILDVVARLPLARTVLFKISPSSLLSRTLCGVRRG